MHSRWLVPYHWVTCQSSCIYTHMYTYTCKHTHKLTCTHNHKSAQPSQGNITVSSDHTTHLVHTRMPYVRSLSVHEVKFRFTAGRLDTCGTLYFTDTCNSMSTPYPVVQIKLKKHLKISSNKTISRQKELTCSMATPWPDALTVTLWTLSVICTYTNTFTARVKESEILLLTAISNTS